MKIQTNNLVGEALNWAVSAAQGDSDVHPYSTHWSDAGPIIEREEIGIKRNAPCSEGRQWEASGSITAKGAGYRFAYGPTPLIAAMRCYVASKLGHEVEVPEELK